MSTLRRSARVATKANSTKFEALPADKVTKPKATKKKEAAVATAAAVVVPEPKEESTSTVTDPSKEIEIGDDIPDIDLSNQYEETLSLKDLASKNDVIIIFAYPKASTPGCTRQACGFRDNFNSISSKALVLGLSADSPKAQKTFQTKQHLQFDLLSDPKKELIGVLGAKKSPSGIKRSHWIFKGGKLVEKRIQISPEVSIKEGKERVLELTK